jgi:hypothetical protein
MNAVLEFAHSAVGSTLAVLLLVSAPARALTVTIKCDAKGVPTETYTSSEGDLLGATKEAVAKAEKGGWADSGGCYSIEVKPKLYPMFGCTTKSCPPRR